MGYFTRPTLTIVLNPEDDPAEQNTITMRKWNAAERQRVLSLSVNLTDADNPRAQLEMAKTCIIEWSGPGFEGRPVTPANIAELPPEVLDTITKPCLELNDLLQDDEKKRDPASLRNGARP